MKQNRLKELYLFSILTLLISHLTACSPRPLPSSESQQESSREIPRFDNIGSEALTYCNWFQSGDKELEGRMEIYLDEAHNYVDDHIRLDFTKAIESLNTPGRFLQFYARAVSSSGIDDLSPKPLVFGLESKATGVVLGGERTLLTAEDIKQAVGHTDLQQFFSQMNFIIRGVGPHWDSLLVLVYESAEASPVVKYNTEALIPAFDVDPSSYSLSHPRSLADIHPHAELLSSNYSPQQLKSRLESLSCFGPVKDIL